MGNKLSRAEMQKRIEGGEAVSFGGRIIKHVDDLPSEEEVSVTVQEKEATLRELRAHHDDVGHRIANLEADIANQKTAEADKAKVDAEVKAVKDKAAAGAAAKAKQTATGGIPPTTNKKDPPAKQEPTIAGRKLSFYQKALTEAKPKNEADAKKVIAAIDGVDDASADKIIAAIKDLDD